MASGWLRLILDGFKWFVVLVVTKIINNIRNVEKQKQSFGGILKILQDSQENTAAEFPF